MQALKKIITSIVIISVVCTVAVMGSYKNEAGQTSTSLNGRPVIIIDAGHGGFDGGAVATDGTSEKNINLNIALSVAEMLKLQGYDVVMTRTTDSGTEDNTDSSISSRKVSDLHNRLKMINSYPDAIFVSVHLNKFTTSSARGAQVFYSKNHGDSSLLGQSIQQSIVSNIQPENDRVIKQSTKSTYLLHNAQIPAVIVECGFLSNPKELELLKSETYQTQLAFCIFCGINDYLNEKGC